MKHSKAFMSLAMWSVFGTMLVTEPKTQKVVEKPYVRPKGHEHRVHSSEENAQRKLHKQSIKARRNVRNGVYTKKFKYPKKRG